MRSSRPNAKVWNVFWRIDGYDRGIDRLLLMQLSIGPRKKTRHVTPRIAAAKTTAIPTSSVFDGGTQNGLVSDACRGPKKIRPRISWNATLKGRRRPPKDTGLGLSLRYSCFVFGDITRIRRTLLFVHGAEFFYASAAKGFGVETIVALLCQ